MKVCHLTSVHPVQDVRILYKECVSLAKAGNDVSLIVKSEKDRILEGVKIIAIREEGNRLKRTIFTALEVFKKALVTKADIYHFHDPELIPVGIILRIIGKKVIYDIHEDLPRQILNKTWIHPWLRSIISKISALLEWVSSRLFFSRIVSATPKIAERFPKDTTIVIQNYPVITELVSNNNDYRERPYNIVYIGGIARIRGTLENITALEYVQNNECQIILAGKFESSEFEKQCRSLRAWNRVDFRGWQNRDQIKIILDNSRIGLVLLHPTINYLDAYPVKLFEYMAAGIPVIASDFPLWRKIVEDAQCGLLVNPLQPNNIAKKIDWLLENECAAQEMGLNGQKAIIEKYNWSIEEKKLNELYSSLN